MLLCMNNIRSLLTAPEYYYFSACKISNLVVHVHYNIIYNIVRVSETPRAAAQVLARSLAHVDVYASAQVKVADGKK